MHTVKTTAFTLTVVTAGLILLLTPNPHQDHQFYEMDTAEQEVPIRTGQVQTAHLEHAQSMIVKQHEATEKSGSATSVNINNWSQILYPELERIVQLENLPAELAIAELVPMLANADPVVRLAAIEALGDIQHPASFPTLITTLGDPDPQIRVAALEGLATRDDSKAWTYIEPYLHDVDDEVRLAAIESLAVMESEQAIHSLAGLLSDHDVRIRHHAVIALGEIGGNYAASYLLQARYDPDETIRVNAEAILAELEI